MQKGNATASFGPKRKKSRCGTLPTRQQRQGRKPKLRPGPTSERKDQVAPAKRKPTNAATTSTKKKAKHSRQQVRKQYKSGGEWDFEKVLKLAQDYSKGQYCEVPTVISDDSSPSALLHAVASEFPKVVSFLNETEIPVDILLDAGRKARIYRNLPLTQRSFEVPLTATCTPLLTRKSQRDLQEAIMYEGPFLLVTAMVVGLENAYAADFKENFEKVLDSLECVLDKSAKGSESLRASNFGIGEQGPGSVIKLGKRAVASVKGTVEEEFQKDLHAELGNMFMDAVRERMREYYKVPAPDGYRSWHERYSEVAGALKTIKNSLQHNPNQSAEIEIPEELVGSYEPKSKEEDFVNRSGNVNQQSATGNDCESTHRPTDTAKSSSGKGLEREVSKNRLGSTSESSADGGRQDQPRRPVCELVRRLLDGDISVPEFEARRLVLNTLLYKFGSNSSYGRHNDKSWQMISPNEVHLTELSSGEILPTAEEMIVVTTCLCTDGTQGHTILEHFRDKSKKAVSTVKTGNNCIHIQSPGANAPCYEHSSKRSENPNQRVKEKRRGKRQSWQGRNW